ncbi:hypothetical protein PAAG_06361 [Paracoccidioides lutzii Pb01]|uniref:Mid2 domain-containing protein n=1 Tax=Paracoccidioides lutzii (strain ATCC MYA-826 / Pb01) TaxID=502779 RepID=C1H6H0_PARBA|nr:hypothetical protein PAAG_06361 [Paracoccidioides lutzii Pb01]EEH35314.1 hypothetical protein PAAG_06361 [Paracoccidioides lutzii Pb01]
MTILRSPVLLLITILSLQAPLSAVPLTVALGGLRRGNGLCSKGHSPCEDPKAPSNFCCPEGTLCITLNNSTSMICCPLGQSCYQMSQKPCYTQTPDPKLNPNSPAKTTTLNGEPWKCGGKCCPPGTRCLSDRLGEFYCQVIYPELAFPPFPVTTTTSQPAPPSPTLTQSGTASHSATPASSTTATNSTSTTQASYIILRSSYLPTLKPTSPPKAFPNMNEAHPSSISNEPKYPGRAIAVGLVPGLVAGILIAMIAIFFYRHRQETRSASSLIQRFGYFRESFDKGEVSISDPIPFAAHDSIRTDFLRRQGELDYEEHRRSTFQRTSAPVRSFFGSLPTAEDIATMPPPNKGGGGGFSGGGVGCEPSAESIKVFSPAHLSHSGIWVCPSVANGRPQTTFSEMMERVGFQSKGGSPYFSVTKTPPLPQFR